MAGSWLSQLYESLMLRWEKVGFFWFLFPFGFSFSDVFRLLFAAENDPQDGKRKCEALWPIFKISHQRSRYIFDLFHKRTEISRELYDFCLEQGYADANLIAKWKKVVHFILPQTNLLFHFSQWKWSFLLKKKKQICCFSSTVCCIAYMSCWTTMLILHLLSVLHWCFLILVIVQDSI